MKLALGSAVLLCAVCAVFCYRSPSSGGSYPLPSIGKYPAPTVFNPRNHGLPDAYKNHHFKRSVEDQLASEHEQFVAEPALDELSRQRRSPKFILPTYRPPRKGSPKIYTV
ncbi:uncharacterized protein [Halyomorpha halys]|uniref:uncharacterized protein n=1 Tax=Halyomorpha halys TaxID=286706 RepID=UPI0006D52185|nr:uncharacterized protein LOC106691427 [Halyomorpha halys]XP_014292686.1 uncharacterized protein LOC106691427 [Halyomorpha halys]